MFSNTDRIYDLEQVRSADAPYMAVHAVGYTYTLHRHHHARSDDPRSGASGVLIAGDHNGTHIDALCHQAESMTMHGSVQVDGCVQTSTGFAAMGAETIEPILGRGVLLDVARHDGVPFLPLETLVSRDDLEAVAAAQGTPINSGDVVLVRTGAGAIWDTPADYIRAAGIAADASAWLADLGSGRSVRTISRGISIPRRSIRRRKPRSLVTSSCWSVMVSTSSRTSIWRNSRMIVSMRSPLSACRPSSRAQPALRCVRWPWYAAHKTRKVEPN